MERKFLVSTPTKRKSITTLSHVLLPYEKNINNAIFCTIVGSFHLISSSFRLVLIEYPLLNQIWVVFDNLYLCQYFKSVSNLEDYN